MPVLVGVAQLAVDLRVRALGAQLVVKGALALRMNYFIKGFLLTFPYFSHKIISTIKLFLKSAPQRR